MAEIPLSARVRALAGALEPPELRTLDAIHLASALSRGDAVRDVVTYDHRMVTTATALGFRVFSPGTT